jgi:hypothetical protein
MINEGLIQYLLRNRLFRFIENLVDKLWLNFRNEERQL